MCVCVRVCVQCVLLHACVSAAFSPKHKLTLSQRVSMLQPDYRPLSARTFRSDASVRMKAASIRRVNSSRRKKQPYFSFKLGAAGLICQYNMRIVFICCSRNILKEEGFFFEAVDLVAGDFPQKSCNCALGRALGSLRRDRHQNLLDWDLETDDVTF